MLRREHAALVRALPDIVRQRLRFVNRQNGSGTRMLVEHLVQEHAMNASELAGLETYTEDTHVAVAACVASGLADVGLGIEAAALEFGLHFVPLVEEDYFLACLRPDLEHPAVLWLRECSPLAPRATCSRTCGLSGGNRTRQGARNDGGAALVALLDSQNKESGFCPVTCRP
jgi:molybdate-binding protein